MRPWPARMTVRLEEFRIAAADWIVSAWGTTMGGLQATAVCPGTIMSEDSSSVRSCQSLGQFRWATLHRQGGAAGGIDQ